MSCPFDKEKLTGYFDGELGGAEKAEVEKHISACSECLRELGDIKSAAGLVRSLPRLKAPASIAAEVRREVSATGRIHSLEKYRRSIFWTFSVAAGLLGVATLSFFVGRIDAPRPDSARALSAAAPPEELARAESKADPSAAETRKNTPEDGAALRALNPDRRRQAGENGEAERERAARQKGEGAPAQDKAGAAPENRALAQQQFGGQAPAKPGAAPKAPSVPAEALAKKNLAEDRPAAPPAPPAAAAPRGEEPLALKDAEKRAPRMDAVDSKQGAMAVASFTIASPQLAATREKTRELLARWKALGPVPPAVGAPNAGEPASLTVELTAAQLEELRKSLEAQAGVQVRAGAPAEAFRDAGPSPLAKSTGGLGGGQGGKLAEEQKSPEPAARGAGAAPAKADAPAPVAKVQATDESKERKVAEKAKSADLLQAIPPPEARQRVTLHFIELPPGK